MADNKQTNKLEREYVIPLRRAWINVPEYKRARKAVMAIKKFIARHMKVTDRNLDNVKLDIYLNNELWYRGKSKPPARIKVKAIKEGDVVQVKFAETPKHVNFLKLRHSKLHKVAEAKKSEEKKTEEKAEKTEEQKADEKEKEKAVEQQNIKQAEQQAKAEKHTTKVKEQKINRMALKK